MLPKTAVFLDMSSNELTQADFTSLPLHLQILYLADNKLAGIVPVSANLLPSLTVLDVSQNYLSGPLPSTLPVSLKVLNLSHNSLTGQLPSSWGDSKTLIEVRLDQNALTGRLPVEWAALGKSSNNSLQLSLLDTNLHGHMPPAWVQQFCLNIVKSTSAYVLFPGILVRVGITTVQAGPVIALTAQHASINVTLGNKIYTFDYSNPAPICSIAYAARNVGLVWGIFLALLLAAIVGVQIWLKRERSGASVNYLSQKLSAVTSYFITIGSHSRLRVPKRIADGVWFFLFDVVWFLYSQVTDGITIHQVFESEQFKYAYILLAILLLPFVFMLLIVSVFSVRLCLGVTGSRTWLPKVLACIVGICLSPLLFAVLGIVQILHGVGVPLPEWFKLLEIDIYAVYRLQSLAESMLNALPQSIIQTKLYMMGNDPSGIHVYISTTLFLYSISGSLLSLLKSVVFVQIEVHSHNYSSIRYCTKLLSFQSLEESNRLTSSGGLTSIKLSCNSS